MGHRPDHVAVSPPLLVVTEPHALRSSSCINISITIISIFLNSFVGLHVAKSLQVS